MKAKVIYGIPEELQNLLFVWLKENPDVNIAHVVQSEGTTQKGERETVITILYHGHY